MDESTDAVDHVLKDVGRVVVHVELGADEGQELRPGTEDRVAIIFNPEQSKGLRLGGMVNCSQDTCS